MILGLLLLAAAFALTGYNIYDSERAERASEQAIIKMEELLDEKKTVVDAQQEEISIYERFPDMEMPVVEVDGKQYIGVIEIPEKGLSLPVQAGEWNYAKLKSSPCLYEGSVYKDNMVIAGHNYRSHFSNIKTLGIGSEVRFADVEGNVFYYEVGWIEILKPSEVEKMIDAKDWDLSLFTCTYGGRERATVRCIRKK